MNGRTMLPGVGLGLLAPQEATRRHLRAGVSVDQFFDELNSRGVRYAVLRWFETLPEVDPGEDIDILVADEDLPALRSLLRSHRVAPARQKFDVYSVTGLPGSDYRGIPYLSPELAVGLLERAVLLRGRYRVPSPQDHFDSLAYHAIYHKGDRSGLPESADVAAPAAGAAEHDYAQVLAGIATGLPLSVRLTMADLDAHLASKGLRPPLDTLEKLSESNPWLRRRLDEEFGPADGGIPGLAVFVVRERATDLLDAVEAELRREGFEPLETVRLEPRTAARARARVRGGNWGAGPWPVSGGGPAAYVVAYDLGASVHDPAAPAMVDRVTASKLAIRRRLLASVPRDRSFNPLHSSDNARQARDYLELLDDPGMLERLSDRVGSLRARMTFPYPVVELLASNRRRAVTAVVEHPTFGECVCKLFYPGAERFLRRELRARTDFAGTPEVPALLEARDNWLLSPRYRDTGGHVRRRLPDTPHVQLTPQTSRALARLAGELHDRGAFLLDLTPLNLMTDPEAGLKVLDWEFLQDLGVDRPALAASPTVLGRAQGAPGLDTPLGVSAGGNAVVTVFSPMVTGLPARAVLGTPAPPAAVAELGLALAYLFRAARTVAKSGKAGSERAARRTARSLVAALERRRSRAAR